MKKIILSLIICAFSAPVLASCSLDNSKPCTALNNPIQHEYGLKNEATPLNNNSKKYEVKNFEKSSKTGAAAPIKNDVQNYNSSCQFGICLPSRSTNNIKK